MERYYCPRCGTRLDVMWQTTMQGAMLLHKVETMAQICFSCNGCGSQCAIAGIFHTPEDALKCIGMRASEITPEWYRKIRERITEQEAESVERH